MEIEKKCSSNSFRNGKIFGARRGGDPYYLDLFCFPSFFNNTESGSSPTSIELNMLEKNLHGKPARFRSEKSYGFYETMCYGARIRSQSGAVDN